MIEVSNLSKSYGSTQALRGVSFRVESGEIIGLQRIGYLPENAPLYPELSVQAHLRMMADLRQIPAAEQPARLSEAVRATALVDHLTRPIGELSKGYRQRVGLAQAILHQPTS